jgi:hypothetical protein
VRNSVATALRWVGMTGAFLLLASSAKPCPFCSAVTSTISENIADSEFACLAICVAPANTKNADALPLHRFRIEQVLKGSPKLVGKSFDVYSFRAFELHDVSLLVGVGEGERIDWAPSPKISDLGQQYARRLTSVPESGPERLEFFLKSLDSSEKMVADDAYNEFARAALKDLVAIKSKLNRHEVINKIKDSRTTRDFRRLYWTLLSICGSPEDSQFVAQAIQNRSRIDQDQLGMDAAINCYLTLGGESALQSIERDFLGNPQSQYVDAYSAINAIRVHSEEIRTISQERLQRAFRLVLARNELADLVIPDLARWQDWTVVQRMEELFQQADDSTQFLKVPVINYLRVCPNPEAASALQRCAALDPIAVRRAQAVYPRFTPVAADSKATQ